jgi:hypothetical protein
LNIEIADLFKSDFVIENQNNYDQSNGVYIESENKMLRAYIEKLEHLLQQKDNLIEIMQSKLNHK